MFLMHVFIDIYVSPFNPRFKCWFLKFKTKFVVKDFCPINFKN